MKVFISLSIVFFACLSFADVKSADCVYESGADSYNKVATVEFVRKRVIKSLWFAPDINSSYHEQLYADSCVRLVDTYVCINPIDVIKIEASFDGEALTVFHENEETTVYSCK